MSPAEDAGPWWARYGEWVARLTTLHPLAWLRDHPFETDSLAAAGLSAISVAGLWFARDHMAPASWRRELEDLADGVLDLQA